MSSPCGETEVAMGVPIPPGDEFLFWLIAETQGNFGQGELAARRFIWAIMPKRERKPFQRMAELDQERHAREMRKYRSQNGIQTRPRS